MASEIGEFMTFLVVDALSLVRDFALSSSSWTESAPPISGDSDTPEDHPHRIRASQKLVTRWTVHFRWVGL